MAGEEKEVIVLSDLASAIDNEQLLYHYTSSITAVTGILESKRLRMSPLKKMNDPMEFQDIKSSFSGNFSFTQAEAKEMFRQLGEANANRNDRIRLVCFSRDDSDNQTNTGRKLHKGWVRSRMWAQYAEAHRGVCLVFSKDKLRDEITREIRMRRLSGAVLHGGPVVYSNDLNEFEQKLRVRLEKRPGIADFTNWYLDGKEKLLFQKLEDYRDEQEFRFVLIKKQVRKDERDFEIRIASCLEAIIVGCEFPRAFWINIRNFGKENKVPTFLIEWELGTPRLFVF